MRPSLAARSTGLGMLALLAALAVGGCGLPSDETFRPIDDLPFGLTETTTTSTTTTTTLPSTTTTMVAPTTTLPASEPVVVYFVNGTQLTPVVRNAPIPTSPQQALVLLQANVLPSDPPGLRSSLLPGALSQITVANGKATVDLLPAALAAAGQEQVLQFGQIVLTLTNQRGIGQVEFRAPGPDGVLAVIPVPRDTGELKSLMSREDYQSLIEPPA